MTRLFKYISVLILLLCIQKCEPLHAKVKPVYTRAEIDSIFKAGPVSTYPDTAALAYAALAEKFRNSQPDAITYHFIKQALKYNRSVSFDTRQRVFSCIGSACTEKGDFGNALYFSKLRLAASNYLKDTFAIINAHYFLGQIYCYMGDWDAAISSFYKCLNEYEKYGKTKDFDVTMWLYYCYLEIGEPDRVIEECMQLKPRIDSADDRDQKRIFYARLADAYQFKDMPEVSNMYYQKSLENSDRSWHGTPLGDDPYSSGFTGKNYRILFKQTGSEKYFRKALDRYKTQVAQSKKFNVPVYLVDGYQGLGMVYFDKGDMRQALIYFKKAEQSSRHKYFSVWKTSLRMISEISQKLKLHDQALIYHQQYVALNDSLNMAESVRKVREEDMEKDNKRKMIVLRAEIEKKLAVSEAENELKIITRNSIIIIMLVVSLLLIALVALHHQRKLKRNQQSFTQRMISLQEEERKKISKELHDGIGQNLLLISHRVDDNQNLIKDTLEELRGIARNLHPVLLEKLGFKKAVENVIRETELNSPVFFSHDIAHIDGLLSPEIEMNLYRIIQECLSNIIKHSKAKDARITLVDTGKSVMLTIEDNGVGFDYAESLQKKSMGLISIKERVHLFNGIFNVVSSKSGTKIEITIKYG